jgi:CelD/BcsL family acetyltransferase involved in cellulose biosynthesis
LFLEPIEAKLKFENQRRRPMPMTSKSDHPAPIANGPVNVADGVFRAVATFDVTDAALWHRWRALERDGVATAFQTTTVIRPLLCELAPAFGARPFVVEVFADDGRHVLSLGLVRARAPLARHVGFPDFGLIDHNAPIWRRDLDLSGGRAEALRRAILAALPGHDALLLGKMPKTVEGRPNPLVDWPGVTEMNVVTMVYDPAARPSADLPAMKESGRKRRKLDREGGAIRRIDDPARARELLDFAFALRAAKAGREGRREALERPDVREFYRTVVTGGLPDGSAVVWEVVLGERTIAMVHGLVRAGHFHGTLMASDDDPGLQPYSPGMIAVATVLDDHVANRSGPFDLGPGEHPYKRRFGGEPAPLYEYGRAATPLGLAAIADRAARRAVRARLRRHPEFRARLYRLLGRG